MRARIGAYPFARGEGIGGHDYGGSSRYHIVSSGKCRRQTTSRCTFGGGREGRRRSAQGRNLAGIWADVTKPRRVMPAGLSHESKEQAALKCCFALVPPQFLHPQDRSFCWSTPCRFTRCTCDFVHFTGGPCCTGTRCSVPAFRPRPNECK